MFNAEKQFFPPLKYSFLSLLDSDAPKLAACLHIQATAPCTTFLSPYVQYTLILCICVFHYKYRLLQDKSVHICMYFLKSINVTSSSVLKHTVKYKVKFL